MGEKERRLSECIFGNTLWLNQLVIFQSPRWEDTGELSLLIEAELHLLLASLITLLKVNIKASEDR